MAARVGCRSLAAGRGSARLCHCCVSVLFFHCYHCCSAALTLLVSLCTLLAAPALSAAIAARYTSIRDVRLSLNTAPLSLDRSSSRCVSKVKCQPMARVVILDETNSRRAAMSACSLSTSWPRIIPPTTSCLTQERIGAFINNFFATT